MSVEKMKLLTLTGAAAELNSTLWLCMESGCFQPEAAGDHVTSLKHSVKAAEENPYKQLLARLQTLTGMGEQPCPHTDPGLTAEECARRMDGIEQEQSQLRSELETLEQEIAYCNACKTQLEHFQSMDVELQSLFDCQFVDVRFGRLPASAYGAAEAYVAKTKTAVWIPFSTDREYCWGMYVAPKESTDSVDLTFASLAFERLHVPDTASTPAEAIGYLNDQLGPDEARAEEIRRLLCEYRETNRESFTAMAGYLQQQSRLCEVRKYAAINRDRFILTGWVPETEWPAFEAKITALPGVEVTAADSSLRKELSPPIRLKNRRFARPFEFYTRMFGMPTYGEVDPTAFVAITYTILYGIMFADVGQGILLALIGYFIMYKRMGNELGRLLLPCGLSGAFFGLVFGSVFGYETWLNPLYRLLGFTKKPVEVMNADNILYVLFAAVGIGMLLMVAALCVNIYSRLKRRQWGEALFGENGVVGLVLYTTALVLVGGLLLKWQLPVTPLLVGGIILPLLLLWLKEPLIKLVNGEKDWQPEGWGGYLTQSFFELFEALLSYVTNTVSFLRVGAFVLVHASMMMVFMTLGSMAGGVAGIIIVIFGNAFVMALEGLLVGVQGLRLEFYEMFNRFFEGAGREFAPLHS